MDENERKRIVNSVDLIVAIFILVLGIIIIIFSLSWEDYISTYYISEFTPDWIAMTTWIFFVLGVTTIVYGIKRMVQDLLH
jgi:hypothetical protein